MKQETNKIEKKIIIYLITLALILSYISIFFIHDITNLSHNKTADADSIQIKIDVSHKQDNNTMNTANMNMQVIHNAKQNEVEMVDYADRIAIKQGNESFSETKELDIFKNSNFNNESKIAPGVEGIYNFIVENESPENYKYNLEFQQNNTYNINMIFKIKRNGTYILGTDEKWINSTDYNFSDLDLNKNGKDLYTIEWKWEGVESDTTIGETEGTNFKTTIKVVATQVK